VRADVVFYIVLYFIRQTSFRFGSNIIIIIIIIIIYLGWKYYILRRRVVRRADIYRTVFRDFRDANDGQVCARVCVWWTFIMASSIGKPTKNRVRICSRVFFSRSWLLPGNALQWVRMNGRIPTRRFHSSYLIYLRNFYLLFIIIIDKPHFTGASVNNYYCLSRRLLWTRTAAAVRT